MSDKDQVVTITLFIRKSNLITIPIQNNRSDNCPVLIFRNEVVFPYLKRIAVNTYERIR